MNGPGEAGVEAIWGDGSGWGDAWPAPAKLNLMLRVVGRRDDGYHELQTVFQLIDRCDRLWFDVRDDGRILRVGDLAGVPEQHDLTVRAARALQQASHCPLGVDIRCHKYLPMGGGLGGGSSDAATTLVALNQLWGTGLSEDELAEIALPLGADVPVFVRGRAAWAEGVGERLDPVELPEPWYLVLVPACAVSTKDVFSHPDLTRDSNLITLADFVGGDAVNDCLPVVRREYSEVGAALELLAAWGGRLTGTGACVFAVLGSQDDALGSLAQLPSDMAGFVAQGRNRSPLLDRMDAESLVKTGRC
ncbi:4-(cytidine 5'-diphospho)-2-C-methyl-D-erythritol kinase [Thiorhodococcus mannitoliphagus]|uniref:4-diphosphocytidyl-2-C-methyl-D-erythritol kinase n=1 Tax=Thiorhodococcus mannitoliphagus TaxID=329406 RepID=A0A6P1E337_9GAMM|nr:4-(cytidine 5'-diphospho)-2-C-methyl-D-erythritol kinase [Thiorhodococcus mannitoliphagus]NEX22105.1 4-(cytidine 5'-diphospho)-2-C-methyl-D-erythritol kinase [Thiorhodococcus mannitoliphagus]